ncbi:phage tail protein [Pseudomonas brassicacearum]|uniref:Phage tail protein n=1 Tax=Pseudomonas brassicacearum TaxID=930166 RepID=A0A423GW48_9PSED|nr:tail fiber assembly protein [Pseudomonas brassicacearum]RON01812.1 phage tail protein [Pseudomonas brassicacearum]
MYYCAADGGFYDLEFHGSVPDGSLEITDETYQALKDGQEKGKWIVAGEQGYPVLIDPLPPTDEVIAAIERQWRDGRLLETDGIVSRHRDELEDGGATTLTLEQYSEVQAYRRLLRNWPKAGEFPLIDHRPPSPLWLTAELQ